MVGPLEVAQYMYEVIRRAPARSGGVYQSDMVDAITKKFGRDWRYTNANGNPAIRRDVLVAFRKLKGTDIKWDGAAWEWVGSR